MKSEAPITATDLAREIIELNPSMTRDELAETFYERAHEIADDTVSYYRNVDAILNSAWSTDIDDAEVWLERIYGTEIYAGCDSSYSAIQRRLAYALVCSALEDEGCDAIDEAWGWRTTYLFIVDCDERGEFSAHIEDFLGNIVADYNKDAVAELIDSGYIKHARDLGGYLETLMLSDAIGEDATLELGE
jgi:hypothetical protein